MNKKESFEYLDNLIVENKIDIIKDYIFKYEEEKTYDQSNKGNPWTDDELRVILSFAPTKENCLLLAKAFKRGYGSVEQIFRWASIDLKTIKSSVRKDDAFVLQIKRICKELGWRA